MYMFAEMPPEMLFRMPLKPDAGRIISKRLLLKEIAQLVMPAAGGHWSNLQPEAAKHKTSKYDPDHNRKEFHH